MRQVQISEELFTRLCAYHLMDRREPLQEQIIQDQLQEKLDRIQARTNYMQGHHARDRARGLYTTEKKTSP